MKRNKTNKRVQRSGQSSYKRHGKRSYHYSERYQAWHDAKLNGREAEASRLSMEHARTFFGSVIPALDQNFWFRLEQARKLAA